MAGYVVRGKFGQYGLKFKAIQFSGLLSNVDHISHGAALIGHNFVVGRTQRAYIIFFRHTGCVGCLQIDAGMV